MIFLLGMFILFSWMKSKSIKNMYRYPSTLNCESVDSLFTLNGDFNQTKYEFYATVDEVPTVNRQGTGMYQCYCKNYAENATNPNLCDTYYEQQRGGYVIGQSVTVAITIVNIVIRSFCIWLIQMVGYKTISGEIAAITVTIFIATFFNTAILLLLADADLS